MAQRLLKAKPRKVAPKKAPVEQSKKIVLVGTYKGKQLDRWPGYYNYPLGEDEFSATKSAKNGRGRPPGALQSAAVRDGVPPSSANLSTTQPFSLSTLQRVNELWLFQGAKAGRFYSAEFVGIFTREELIRDYGCLARGKAQEVKNSNGHDLEEGVNQWIRRAV